MVVGTGLPVLRRAADGYPGGAARLHPTGAGDSAACILVLLSESSRVLSLHQGMPRWLAHRRAAIERPTSTALSTSCSPAPWPSGQGASFFESQFPTACRATLLDWVQGSGDCPRDWTTFFIHLTDMQKFWRPNRKALYDEIKRCWLKLRVRAIMQEGAMPYRTQERTEEGRRNGHSGKVLLRHS